MNVPDNAGDVPLDVGTEFESSFSQRRIRHIISIQVRNLTPFPARDAFASALTQPSEQSQFTTYGPLSDDLDVTLSRRRSRRISVNSMKTLRSLRSEDGAGDDGGYPISTTEPRGRERVDSKTGQGFGSLGSARPPSSSGSTPSFRTLGRRRTSSIVSSVVSPYAPTSSSMTAAPSVASTSMPLSAMMPDHSQTGLERVINSRLVETFVAITIPVRGDFHATSSKSENLNIPSQPPSPSPRPRLSSPKSAPPTRESFPSFQAKTVPINTTPARKSSKPFPLTALNKDSVRTQPTSSRKPISSHLKSSSTSTVRINGKKPPTPTSDSSQRSPSPKAPFPPPNLPTPPGPSIPNYLSPVHRSSTNPVFAIYPRDGHEFASWTDLSGEQLKIELWGKLGNKRGNESFANGSIKGKMKEGSDEAEIKGNEWKVLQDWDLHLNDLVPIPKELSSHESQFPYNSLLVTLSPPGQTYYLPTRNPITRAPSPSAGYTSDPESEMRKVKQSGDVASPISATALAEGRTATDVVARSRRRYRKGGTGASEADSEKAKTSSWQDLVKLVNLQSCIEDNQGSLSEVVRGIDKFLEGDIIGKLKHEVSERESTVQELREHCAIVKNASSESNSQIATRREQMRIRRETLRHAREIQQQELDRELNQRDAVEEEFEALHTIRTRFPPIRISLLSDLSSIFPIELYSPPDLLYTILDVPLPIPISTKDPGPPLSLPAHKEVTEDAIATALGYAAQVVQLLAAYLGKGLIYPVTCIGSRSLIKDSISAMVGPRMFPLFPKGVETYRFEYAVFLLNKDIEMLMADRDLRALDMRHTLPNLKNLLLTLTNGEGSRLSTRRYDVTPISGISHLDPPAHPSSPSLFDNATISLPRSPTKDNNELPSETTPPASGSTTPTATDSPRKSRAFLGLAPLAGFLRGRYPSASRSPAKSDQERPENGEESGGSTDVPPQSDDQPVGGSDEDDRRTIRGLVVRVDLDIGSKGMNGHSDAHPHLEKLVDEEVIVPSIKSQSVTG